MGIRLSTHVMKSFIRRQWHLCFSLNKALRLQSNSLNVLEISWMFSFTSRARGALGLCCWRFPTLCTHVHVSTHTHTHTCSHSHTSCMRVHTHMHVFTHRDSCMHRHPHTRTHTHTHARVHAHVLTHAHVCSHPHFQCTRVRAHTMPVAANSDPKPLPGGARCLWISLNTVAPFATLQPTRQGCYS